MWKTLINFKLTNYYPAINSNNTISSFFLSLFYMLSFLIIILVIFEIMTYIITPYPFGVTFYFLKFLFVILINIRTTLLSLNNVGAYIIFCFLTWSLICLFFYYIWRWSQTCSVEDVIIWYLWCLIGIMLIFYSWSAFCHIENLLYIKSYIKYWILYFWFSYKWRIFKFIWIWVMEGHKEEPKALRALVRMREDLSILYVWWSYHIDRKEYWIRKWIYSLLGLQYNKKWEDDLTKDIKSVGKGVKDVMNFLPGFNREKVRWLKIRHFTKKKKNIIKKFWYWLKEKRKKK